MKLVMQLSVTGNKKEMYQLKEEILRQASQHSCSLSSDLFEDDNSFKESMSASFSPVVEVSSDDIVDMTLTGDEQYELLELQEKKNESSPE